MKTSILKVKDTNTGTVHSVPALKGESAYQAALKGGFTGTKEEFYQKLGQQIAYDNLTNKPIEENIIFFHTLNKSEFATSESQIYITQSDDLSVGNQIIANKPFLNFRRCFMMRKDNLEESRYFYSWTNTINLEENGSVTIVPKIENDKVIYYLDISNLNFIGADQSYLCEIKISKVKPLSNIFISNETLEDIQTMIDNSITNYDNEVMSIIGEEG